MIHFGPEPISPAFVTGLLSFFTALLLAFLSPQWAAIPLAIFVLLCLTAPFFPTIGFFLPVVCSGKAEKNMISLTFDDGPDPVTTKALLDLLEKHHVSASFFVTGERALRFGELIGEILKRGHDIGNHSYHHDPLLMLRRSSTVIREIESTQSLLRRFGIEPVAFRPPVGIINPKLAVILPKLGLFAITFSCRANDFGNRRLDALSGKILRKVKPGDIVMLHDIKPEGASAEIWLREVDLILSGLKEKGLRVVALSKLIERPIMRRIEIHGSEFVGRS